MITGTTSGTIESVLPLSLGRTGGVERLLDGTKDVLGPKEDGASAGKGRGVTGVLVGAAARVGGGLVTREGSEDAAPAGDSVDCLDAVPAGDSASGLGAALLLFINGPLEEPSPPPPFLFSASFFLALWDNMAEELDPTPAKINKISTYKGECNVKNGKGNSQGVRPWQKVCTPRKVRSLYHLPPQSLNAYQKEDCRQTG